MTLMAVFKPTHVAVRKYKTHNKHEVVLGLMLKFVTEYAYCICY